MNRGYDIEIAGEESGREEALCDFPPLPNFSTFSFAENKAYARKVTQHGRGRAQGFYGLRGKRAKAFAVSWRMGYFATYDLLRREGYLVDTTPEEG